MRTRILIEGKEVDLVDEVTIPITYNIVDIRNPEKKTGNYSRQIILPGTTKNDLIFSQLWDLSVTVDSSGTTNYNSGFDPNLKASVIVIDEGSIVFDGFVRLNKITQSHYGYNHGYDITLQSQYADLYTNMGEKTLADLNFDKYNHTYNQTEQQNSWATSIKVNGASTAFALGQGYVYPMIDYGHSVNDVDYNVSHFFPAVYAKTVYDQIVAENGFQVTSSFFNSTEWKSLVVPYSGGQLKLSEDQVFQRTHRASSTTDWIDYVSGSTSAPNRKIIFQDDSTGSNHDAGNVYSTSLYKMTVAKQGTYTMNFGMSIRLTHFPTSSPASPVSHTILGQLVIWKKLAGSSVHNAIAMTTLEMDPNGAAGATGGMVINVGSSVSSGTVSPTASGLLSGTAQLQVGDEVFCDFYITSASGSTPYFGQTYGSGAKVKVEFLSGSYFESKVEPSVQEGDTVSMSTILPNTIKQKDFISSINKIFNLYYEPDKNVINNFFVEPRNDFYSSGTTRDWSNKLDCGTDLEIVPMGELDARRYVWSWKPDTDYYNKLYSDRNSGKIYGEREYSIVNDFIKNENKTEVIFSATPLASRPNSDRIIPRIYDYNGTTITPKVGNIRLLYYGGVKTTLNPWSYVASSGTTTMTTYAYAGHLDSVSSPTFDLNFGVPKEVFYNATSYTNNNTFNKYWLQFINEITDKNSKIVTGNFYLTARDIELLYFRDTFYFKEQNFRLNKIIDYVPGSNSLTKCEFILLKQGTPFISQSVTTNNGKPPIGFTNSDEEAPTGNERVASGANSSGRNVVVTGEYNIVDPTASGIIVSGNYNSVGAGCKNISLVSSSGCTVLAGVENVSLINCTNLTIDSTYEGKQVVENVIYGAEKILYTETSYTLTASDVGKFVIGNPAANIVVNLPSNTTISEGWTVKIKHGNGGAFKVTTTITDVGVAFDATGTTDILNALEYSYYTYRSNVWYIH